MLANGQGGSATVGTSTLHGMNGMPSMPMGETAGASVVTSPSMPPLSSSATSAAPASASTAASATGAAATAEAKAKDGKSIKAEGSAGGSTPDDKKKNKRCMFQKEVVKTLKQWLSQNFENPYPTEEEKKYLAANTGLTQLQVNNWFINARRRLVQPLVEKYNKDHPGSTPLPSVQEAQKSRRRRQVNRDGTALQSPAKMGKFDGLSPGGHVGMQGMPGAPQSIASQHVAQGHGPMPVPQGGIAMPSSSSQSMAAPMTAAFNPQLLSMQPIFAGQHAPGMNMPQAAFWDPAHSYLQPTMSFVPSGAATIDTSISGMIPTFAPGWNTMATSNYGGSKPK